WIVKKSEAVAKELSITISPTPVGPPAGTNTQTPSPSGPAPTNGGNTGGNSGGRANVDNAAGSILPTGGFTMAVLIGASAVASLML
ncbi:hypothetical protein BGZ83_009605, partial [Gryganskiella cystojenkinii]